jgi:phage recombination protein Bet
MSNITAFSNIQLTQDVKRSFEENYLKMLFEKHKELPKSDIIEFIHKAQQTGANPSLNQIFLIERNTKVGFEWKKVGTVVFSYNFIQAIANQTGDYEGYTLKTDLVDKFDINTFEAKKMLASTCVVKRRGREFPYTAYFDEYVQTKENKSNGRMEASGTWASKPYMMIEKCALSGALRRAFPEALSGMYCEEEMEAVTNEFDKSAENNAIEVKAIQRVEKVEAILEKSKPESVAEIKSLIAGIRDLLGELTEGKPASDKASAMKEFCGINKFSELDSKPIEELKLITNKIHENIKERKLREANIHAKPSFKIEV